MNFTGWVICTIVVAIGMACTFIIGYASGRSEERQYWGARRKPRDTKINK